MPGAENRTYYPRPEFLSRARVTAKRLGLVPVELPKWVPEPESYIYVHTKDSYNTNGDVGKVLQATEHVAHVTYLSGETWTIPLMNCRPATHEEVAKYHADQEAARPIVFYDTKVMCQGKEWRLIEGPSHNGEYVLHRLWNGVGDTVHVKRHEFTVIG